MSDTTYSLEGLDLRKATNLRWDIVGVDGIDSFPMERGGEYTIPFRQGGYVVQGKPYYDGKELAIAMEIIPWDASGASPQSVQLQLRDNVDALLGALWKRENRVLTLTRTYSDGQIRKIDFRTSAAMPLEAGSTRASRRLVIIGRSVEPFWREDPTTGSPHSETGITTTSHGFNVSTGGNAPIADAVIRFAATSAVLNPKLSWNSGVNDEYVAYGGTISAGKYIDIDCGNRTATWDDGSRADAGIDFAYPWWMELPPASTVAFLAECGGASDWDVTITWKDKWF